MPALLFLPTICSAQHACRSFLLLRCSIDGSYKRIVAISEPSCTGLTPKQSYSHTSWDAPYCACFKMTMWASVICIDKPSIPCMSTLSLISGTNSQLWAWQFKIYTPRYTDVGTGVVACKHAPQWAITVCMQLASPRNSSVSLVEKGVCAEKYILAYFVSQYPPLRLVRGIHSETHMNINFLTNFTHHIYPGIKFTLCFVCINRMLAVTTAVPTATYVEHITTIHYLCQHSICSA